MKRALAGSLIVAAGFAAVGSQTDRDSRASICDTACTQSALLRIGMNLEVSDRIRKGNSDGALRLLNTMNVLEITPMLHSPDNQDLADMKRRVFRKLVSERSKFSSSEIVDEKTAQLNRDIDEYLKKYR